MKRRSPLPLFLALLIIIMCACHAGDEAPDAEGVTKPMSETETLPKDFILGMDASCVPALEKSGVIYYNDAGQIQDVFQTLAEHGLNYIRVRVWNHPYDADGHGYGGGNCDLKNALEIGKRATQHGMKLLVNFHYSDFWADPAKQKAPLDWENLSFSEKEQALYEYTLDSLQQLKEAGIAVGMVQIGNETNGKLCGESDWKNICSLMNHGARAVREVFPSAMVALHFANPEKSGSYAYYAKQLDTYQVDYDVFASSYYPYWHGSLENLSSVLRNISQNYRKKVMVAETSYAYTRENTDFWNNTVSNSASADQKYPYSVNGQQCFLRDLLTSVAKIPNAIGVFYWEGTWISVGQSSLAENQALWEQYGSGWASSYASGYDPDDAGRYYGGCAVENQALFDADGHPLQSLDIFCQMLEGYSLPQEKTGEFS